MAARVGLVLCALLVAPAVAEVAAAAGSRAKATPISKVLEMMSEMEAKGIAEKKAEEVAFTTFYQWCGDQTRIYNDEIAKNKATIEELNAYIEKAAVHIKQLTARIEELEEDIGRWTKDQKSATDVRDKEKADFVATSADYTESLTAIDGALTVLKKQATNTAQTESATWEGAQAALLQVSRAKMVPMATKKAITAFIQQPSVEEMPDERLLRSAPEAYGYEFQSGGVIEMLEKLKDDFEGQMYELEKDEKTAQHAFDQIMQQLTDNIENAQHEINKKTALRAKRMQDKADAEADLAAEEAELAANQKYLDEMTSLCAVKKADFESRQELREGEIAAIHQAIEIISSETVAGAGENHLPASALNQVATSLVQVRSSTQESELKDKLTSFLKERAEKYNSKLLSTLAESAAANPFVKVKKMIKDLIWKLMEEATAETEHKGWCDTELGTNKINRETLTAELNDLVALEEDLTATIAELTQAIEQLTEEISVLENEMAKASEERAESKATNAQTVEDAKAAQVAVTNAIAILKDFYAASAEATAFAQKQKGFVKEVDGVYYDREATDPEKDAPATFEKPYKGMLPEGGNVIDFLDVILTDFARLQSETETQEAQEVDAYEKFMHESKMSKSLKENDKGHKSDKKAEKESALQECKENIRTTEEELDAAVKYYEKLKPTCVDSGITYEDRVKRREAEMQSLKEALGILQGTSIDLDLTKPR